MIIPNTEKLTAKEMLDRVIAKMDDKLKELQQGKAAIIDKNPKGKMGFRTHNEDSGKNKKTN